MTIMRLPASRRRFLQGTVALTGAGAMSATAGLLLPPTVAAFATAGAKTTVVLHDPRLALDARRIASLAASGARIIALEADPVRQWRGIERELLANSQTRILGMTRWPEFLIVRGLAAESRRRVRHESMDATTGVMTWLIA